MIRLSIVCPCYNEEAVIASSARRLRKVIDDLAGKKKISPDSFILLVNDGSTDGTWAQIEAVHRADASFKGLCLAANVGHQNAIMAGMMFAKDHCDAVITIDVDLQDSLEAIEQMVDKHAEGKDIVYGVKVCRKADSFVKRTSAQAFYRFQQSMGVKAVYNHADFRLMSRRALEQLSLYGERNLYLRGLIPMLGYPSDTVEDVISLREAGKSKYTLGKMYRLAIDGITSFSTKPITMIIGAGLICVLIALLSVVYVVASYVEHKAVPGWSSLMLSVWLIGGLLLISMGIIGEYIGKIYIEVKHRPLYHIGRVLWQDEPAKDEEKADSDA